MDSVARPAGPDMWNVESTGGAMMGAIEKRAEGFVVIPSVTSPLGDLDPLPYASLEAAMAGIAAHTQGRCELEEPSSGNTG